MTTSHIHLPDLIEVLRSPGGSTALIVDGVPLEYAMSGSPDDAPAVRLSPGCAPSVTITLVAKSVHVLDDALLGAEVIVDFPGHKNG